MNKDKYHDYHMHTSESDGELNVEKLLAVMESRNLERIAISDHDTLGVSYDVYKNYHGKVKCIPAFEITCKSTNFGIETCEEASIHMLGYGLVEDIENLVQKLDKRNTKRYDVFKNLTHELNANGYVVTLDKIIPKWGKLLQIADVRAEVIAQNSNVDEQLLETFIAKYNAKLDAVNFTPAEAITMIHDHGGIAIWAHPFNFYALRGPRRISAENIDKICAVLKAEGLDGIEAFYGAFTFSDQALLVAIGAKYDFLFSTGSDFHNLKYCGQTISDELSLAYNDSAYYKYLVPFLLKMDEYESYR